MPAAGYRPDFVHPPPERPPAIPEGNPATASPVVVHSTAEVAELVALATEGDRGAFDELVRRTYADTYTLAFRLTGDQEDACDVVQETYLRVFRGIRRFRGDAQFSTWMYRITANCANTLMSKRHKHRHDELAEAIAPCERPAPAEAMRKVDTPTQKTCEDVAALLGIALERTAEIPAAILGVLKTKAKTLPALLDQADLGELSHEVAHIGSYRCGFRVEDGRSVGHRLGDRQDQPQRLLGQRRLDQFG